MGTHKITYLESRTQPITLTGVCRCGQRSEKGLTRQKVEDWELKHLEEVEVLKARLGTSTPSLKSQAAYYRRMAEEDPDLGQRPLWTQLADELEKRLGKTPSGDDQPMLEFSD